MNIFIKGFILGFSIAVTVGPISLLCIRRALVYGRLSGFISGLGASVADSFYSAVAGLGLTVVSQFLFTYQNFIRWGGGLFLCYLGIKTLLSPPPQIAKKLVKSNLLSDFASTFALTITNPLTIIFFMAVFAVEAVVPVTMDYQHVLFLVLGVFVGTTLWWFILSQIIGFVRKTLNAGSILWINRISGVMIMLWGFFALFKKL